MSDNKKNNNNVKAGATFSELLGIAFIILKLCGVITWSWGWVLAPIWIPWVVGLVVCLILWILVIVKTYKYKKSCEKTEERG